LGEVLNWPPLFSPPPFLLFPLPHSFLEKGFCYVARTGLELLILLPPKY
jgi:hypothetical protein